MGCHAVAQFLQPVTQLIAIPRLILNLIAKLVAKQTALFIRARGKVLLLVAKLLLRPRHVLRRQHYFCRQGLIECRATS